MVLGRIDPLERVLVVLDPAAKLARRRVLRVERLRLMARGLRVHPTLGCDGLAGFVEQLVEIPRPILPGGRVDERPIRIAGGGFQRIGIRRVLAAHVREVAAHRLEIRVPIVGAAREAAAHDADDSRVERRHELPERHLLAEEDRVHHARAGLAGEGALARQQFVEDRADREDVHAVVDALARVLLGRHAF